MSPNSSIVKSVFGYSISSWTNLLLGFLYVIISTRLLLPETYGRISLFYSISGVVLYVLTLGMDGALIRFYNEPPAGDTKSQLLYKDIVISLIVCIIVSVFGCLFFYESISNKIFGICSRVLVGMFFLYTTSQVIFRYLNISFRMSFQTKRYNIQNILISSLLRFLIVVAAFLSDDFVFIVSFLTLGIVITLVIYLIVQRNEYLPKKNNGEYDYSIKLRGYGKYYIYALFCAPAYVSAYLNLYLGQQIVITKLGAHELGIFASVGIFSQILTSVKGGFSTFWSAYVYKYYQIQKDVIIKMHDYVVAISIVGVSILVLSRDIIYVFIGKGFHESKLFFSILLIMPVLATVQETTAIGIYLKKHNELSLINIICATAINVMASLFLINYYGLIGAAIGNALSGIYLYTANTVVGQYFYKSIKNIYRSIFGMVLLIIILMMPVYFESYKNAVIVILLVNLAGFYLYREEYVHIIDLISKRLENKN